MNLTPRLYCCDVVCKGPVEGTGKYDYRYTGTHDHGTLPALKTGGPHGELVKALLVSISRIHIIFPVVADLADGGANRECGGVDYVLTCWFIFSGAISLVDVYTRNKFHLLPGGPCNLY